MNEIEKIIQTACEACQFDLYGIERSDRGLIVYIENKSNNVSIKDCEDVMRQITYSTETDHLHIEISSKGLYPILFTPKHYQDAIGHWVKVRTKDKSYKGELLRIEADAFLLQKNEHQFNIPLSTIQSARLIPTPRGE
jgi:ribosome maturation factor RimP